MHFDPAVYALPYWVGCEAAPRVENSILCDHGGERVGERGLSDALAFAFWLLLLQQLGLCRLLLLSGGGLPEEA